MRSPKGRRFKSFSPAISKEAQKKMAREIRAIALFCPIPIWMLRLTEVISRILFRLADSLIFPLRFVKHPFMGAVASAGFTGALFLYGFVELFGDRYGLRQFNHEISPFSDWLL